MWKLLFITALSPCSLIPDALLISARAEDTSLVNQFEVKAPPSSHRLASTQTTIRFPAKSISQPTSQFIAPPETLSIANFPVQLNNQLIEQLAEQPNNQPNNQPIEPLNNQPIEQPTAQLPPQVPPLAPTPPTETSPQPTTLRLTVRPTEEIRLKLASVPPAEAGKIAVFAGTTDITSQINLVDNEIIYQPGPFALPIGDIDIVVYLVKTAQTWQELTRLALKVTDQPEASPNPPTTEKPQPANSPPDDDDNPVATGRGSAFLLKPTLNLNFQSQFFEQRTAAASKPDLPLTNLTLQGGFTTEFATGTFSNKTNVALFGSTFQNEALRFSQLAERAPQLDLSDYLIDTTWGPVQFLLGHTCHGNHPFLLSNVCSRGLVLKIKPVDRLSIDFSSMRSQSIVGFDNLLGIDNSENNTNAITIGYDIIKTEAGSNLRLESTYMDGSKIAEGNFNVGEVIDAEESRGFGLRLTGNDSRFNFDVGYALSRFTNPSRLDPDLTTELDVVEVKPVTKDAYYLEANYDLIKDLPLGGDRTFSLALAGRHERINPLFKTLGADIGADQLQTQIGLTVSLAGATLQLQFSQTEDNLANIPTVLKTKNRATSFNLALPLQTILQSTSGLLPTITYDYQLNRQLGVNFPIPEQSAFDASEIPDQVTIGHRLGLSWTSDTFTLAYEHSNTLQDNRQLSRETSDFLNSNNQITASWQVSPRLQLSTGITLTAAKNFETNVVQTTTAPNLGITWQVLPSLTWTFNLNRTDNTDSLNNNFNRSSGLETILSQDFKITLGQTELAGTAFIRYSRQSNRNQDRIFNLETDATIHVINGGFSLSF